jgi:hypothetical protein
MIPKSSDPPLICDCSGTPATVSPDVLALLRSQNFTDKQICEFWCRSLAAAAAQKSAAAGRR